MVKCLPTTQKTRVQSLGWDDLLEKEMAPHSSTLAWKIPWTEKPGRLQFMGSQPVGPTERLHFHSQCIHSIVQTIASVWFNQVFITQVNHT